MTGSCRCKIESASVYCWISSGFPLRGRNCGYRAQRISSSKVYLTTVCLWDLSSTKPSGNPIKSLLSCMMRGSRKATSSTTLERIWLNTGIDAHAIVNRNITKMRATVYAFVRFRIPCLWPSTKDHSPPIKTLFFNAAESTELAPPCKFVLKYS